MKMSIGLVSKKSELHSFASSWVCCIKRIFLDKQVQYLLIVFWVSDMFTATGLGVRLCSYYRMKRPICLCCIPKFPCFLVTLFAYLLYLAIVWCIMCMCRRHSLWTSEVCELWHLQCVEVVERWLLWLTCVGLFFHSYGLRWCFDVLAGNTP